MVEVPPFLTDPILNPIFEGDGILVDGDPLKLFGLDRLECHSDPPGARSDTPKHHIFEFCGLGEVKQRRLGRVRAYERW